MEFSEGQEVRINESAQVSEFVKGRLAIVDEVIPDKNGTKYSLALWTLRIPVAESDIRAGPGDMVH